MLFCSSECLLLHKTLLSTSASRILLSDTSFGRGTAQFGPREHGTLIGPLEQASLAVRSARFLLTDTEYANSSATSVGPLPGEWPTTPRLRYRSPRFVLPENARG